MIDELLCDPAVGNSSCGREARNIRASFRLLFYKGNFGPSTTSSSFQRTIPVLGRRSLIPSEPLC